jgi:hypothetical protein
MVATLGCEPLVAVASSDLLADRGKHVRERAAT